MPFPKLPPDSQPSEADIQAILRADAFSYSGINLARTVAELIWKYRRMKADPNAFLVPFWSDDAELPSPCTTYASYLRCDHWKVIQQRVMERAGHLCECCGEWAREVHIRDYRPRVLAGDDPTPLVAVCPRCRDYLLEDPVTGGMRDHEEQEAALARIYAKPREADMESISSEQLRSW